MRGAPGESCMKRFLAIFAAVGFAANAFAAPALKPAGPIFIDLQDKANQKLTDDVGGRVANNNLAKLPTGEQTFANVKFKVGKSFVQLNSPLLKVAKPEKV